MSKTSEESPSRTEQPAALAWHVWVVRYDDGRRKDRLVFGNSNKLADHAPAISASQKSEVEHLGTFADFAGKRDTLDLNLSSQIVAPAELSAAIGRGQFWDVVYGRV